MRTATRIASIGFALSLGLAAAPSEARDRGDVSIRIGGRGVAVVVHRDARLAHGFAHHARHHSRERERERLRQRAVHEIEHHRYERGHQLIHRAEKTERRRHSSRRHQDSRHRSRWFRMWFDPRF